MADSSLSERDREFFLAEPHVAALSLSAGQGRGPLTVPIWYQYAPGGEAWVLTEAGSRKARLIEAAGRFTLLVERVMPTVWYVSVEGPVTRTVPGTDELLREIAARYLPPDKVPAYIEFVNVELGEQVAIYLRPERWLDRRGRRPPHSARSGAALDLVRLNSAAQTSGERRAASGEWQGDRRTGRVSCAIRPSRQVAAPLRWVPAPRSVTVMGHCLPSAWNGSWNAVPDNPSATSAVIAMTCAIGAASAHGARGRTSCKRVANATPN